MLNLREDQGASPHHVVVVPCGSRRVGGLSDLNPAGKLKWGNQSTGNNFVFTWDQHRPKADAAAAQQSAINDCAVMAAAIPYDDVILILIDHEMPPRELKRLVVRDC